MIRIEKLGGLCPVQADVYFLGYYGYFRSRWDTSTIEFAKSEKEWENNNIIWADYNLFKTEMYEAGYLAKWKCRLLIYFACLKFWWFLIETNEKV